MHDPSLLYPFVFPILMRTVDALASAYLHMTMESGGSRKENSYIGFQENPTLGTLIFSRDCLKGFIPVNTKEFSPNGSLLWIFFFQEI